MKKNFLLILAILAIAFSVSACSSSVTNTPVADNSLDYTAVDSTNPVTVDSIAVDSSKPTDEQINNLAAPISATAPDNNLVSSPDESAVVTEKPVQNNNMPAPDKQIDLIKQYSQALVKTNFGDVTLKFYTNETPLAANNFLNLAQAGFYNGTKFHRIMKDFMIQGGDPLTKEADVFSYGTGGPGYKFKNETGSHKLVAGSLAMANSGPDTNGSQFFIVTAASTPWLDGSYTNFGEVVSGMDIVRKIENVAVKPNPGNPSEVSFPTQDVIINSIELLK